MRPLQALVVLTAVHLVLAGRAGAEELRDSAPNPPRTWVNLRVGGSNVGADARATVCLELAPLEALSVEGCGTGAGILPGRDPSELAHFRLKGVARLAGRGGHVVPASRIRGDCRAPGGGELRLDTAWLPHAPRLRLPQGAWQPSGALTFGLGF